MMATQKKRRGKIIKNEKNIIDQENKVNIFFVYRVVTLTGLNSMLNSKKSSKIDFYFKFGFCLKVSANI